MLELISAWFGICLLRTQPQDLPASRFLLGLSLASYALVSLLVSVRSYGMAGAIQVAMLDIGLLTAFVLCLLYLQSKTARINQTLSALAGCGSLLGVFALPLVLLVQPGQLPDQIPVVLSLFWLLLFVWNLLMMAHIMRHALSSSFATGLAFSVLYMLVTMQVIATVFPRQVG